MAQTLLLRTAGSAITCAASATIVCPVCGAECETISCKVVCPRCHTVVMNCSEFRS